MSFQVSVIGKEAYYSKKIVSMVFDFIGVRHEFLENSLSPQDFNFYVTREGVKCGEPDPSRPVISFTEDEGRLVWMGYINSDLTKKPDGLLQILCFYDFGRELIRRLKDHAEVYSFPGFIGFDFRQWFSGL